MFRNRIHNFDIPVYIVLGKEVPRVGLNPFCMDNYQLMSDTIQGILSTSNRYSLFLGMMLLDLLFQTSTRQVPIH